MKAILSSLLWASSLVHFVKPFGLGQNTISLEQDDISPIGDPQTYYPEQHDCPLTCVDYTNLHSWIPYHSLEHLRRCHEPMLLQFSAMTPLNDQGSVILIYACTLRQLEIKNNEFTSTESTDNPKKAKGLLRSSLDASPACFSSGKEIQSVVHMAQSGTLNGEVGAAMELLDGMKRLFGQQRNCDETFLFASYEETVAAVYVGDHLGKGTITSALQSLKDHLRTTRAIPARTVVELCNNGSLPERTLGIAVDTTHNVALVQKMALEWSNGNCASTKGLASAGNLHGVKIIMLDARVFQRIGYYESYNFERDCLWLKARNANTDASYTHMHWAFAAIDPKTWKPVIKDDAKQWSDFKRLYKMKRIVSFGGWAYSTEPATYNIMRQAIINNRDVFPANLVQFVKDEGIDGIDIDWEYPGAPDIMGTDGRPIGQKTDGLDYLKFLYTLKKLLGAGKSVSIAAPASYWYLKAFPIERIANIVDYIVYMTYDLHGQWDYGNPNAYDSCPSGKCIRSHVNVTETRNALAMITKAGVPNNRVFVGEASYGRSFHMAKDGCWGLMCDFTGSKNKSDAAPGRCTNSGGYLAYAEILEIIQYGKGARTFHEAKTDTDVMIYKGDYVSYMTPQTKDSRRALWKDLNFAGSIDWAVDIQAFTADEYPDGKSERPEQGEGCVWGVDLSLDSGELCAFSCNFGYCPKPACRCVQEGEMKTLPPEKLGVVVMAYDKLNLDVNRLCKFACRYGHCPDDICIKWVEEPDESDPLEVGDETNYFNYTDVRWQNSQKCVIFKSPEFRDVSVEMCKPVCQDAMDEAKEEGRTTNYGCMGFFPHEKAIPWIQPPGSEVVAVGQCICDNWLLNELADTVLEAMPMIAQIGCYILMSSVKLAADIGAQFIPGAGRVLDAGLGK